MSSEIDETVNDEKQKELEIKNFGLKTWDFSTGG